MHQQPLVAARWLFLADKIEKDAGLLEIPLQNISNWRNSGRLGDTRPLDDWEKMIRAARQRPRGLKDLLVYMRDNSEESRALKSCSPFAGVLTREERDQFTCAWTH
ncbi:MAG: hypothetical protein KJO79_05925 [Verrucomicrobiae bacterium]|nr:hypothetical protein [Verrucomicrobiae bacterium]NNJ86700.1 hypothetical protein [Akkermansiaceae bacterium]